ILMIAGWAYLQSRKNSTGELQSKEDPKLEARKWIKRHPKTRTKQQSPLAWHARFMSAASAMQFVEKLYQQGAIEVQIDPDSLLKSWVPQVGLYVVRPDADATALLILLPKEGDRRAISAFLDHEVRTGSGTPRIERRISSVSMAPSEPGQEVVRLSWPNHRVVI
ncbi:MAG: hypothetical protein WCF79_09615, partial [Rhodomicrobium sp.]